MIDISGRISLTQYTKKLHAGNMGLPIYISYYTALKPKEIAGHYYKPTEALDHGVDEKLESGSLYVYIWDYRWQLKVHL